MPAEPSKPSSVRRTIFSALFTDTSPLDLRLLGRTLIHAVFVGIVAGLMSVLFFGGLEIVEELLLSKLAGYERIRAAGESMTSIFGGEGSPGHPGKFRPWLLVILPGLGALAGGLLTAHLAPEAQGGGGDAMIHAFHHQAGAIRRRVAWVKGAASILTLGSGGSGGREGPTMLIGASLGSMVASVLRVGARERRLLMIAGVAAGMSAIFRTPLGAALLATEVLYRDDFEADALIPALLASVTSYSVFISFFGEATLFAHAPRYPFIPGHLPLYGLLAVLIAALAATFVAVMHGVKGATAKLRLPLWLKPGIGGLLLGVLVTPVLMIVGNKLGSPGQGLGLLGGGYGAAQAAITGAPWLPEGHRGVEVLLVLCVAKLVATSLTVGTGGSAGDFAPSLVMGGLFGGAFGRAAQLLTGDGRIDPGAFALVGMGTFYGGIAHVPVSSLVMVCELAGSYDLLVPLMLAEAIAFVVLRRRTLYGAQLPTKRESPAHRTHLFDVLGSLLVRDVMIVGRPWVSFAPATPAREMVKRIGETTWQDVFPVLGPSGSLEGVITSESLRVLATEPELETMAVAADAMQAPVIVRATDPLRTATEVMVENALRELPVSDETGSIIGFVGESDIGKAYLQATERSDATPFPKA